MHNTSHLYKTILENQLHEKDVKVRIAGADYGMDQLVSMSVSGGVFDRPGIGYCASRQIDVVIRDPGNIPRQAKMEIFVRLVLGEMVSEWLPKGVFFISTRSVDKHTGTLTIHGFDSMLKANEVWLTADYNMSDWPMNPYTAARDIASRIGTALDSRTVLDNAFPVEYPVYEDTELTMTEVLEFMAIANAGSWIITDKGELLLLKYGDIPPETYYLVTEYGDAITFGGVRILIG